MKRQIKLWLLIIFIVIPTTANAQQIDWVTDIAWNADGTLIAISHFNGSIEVWSASTNTLVWSMNTSGTSYLDWHPTNPTELAYEQFDGPVTIVDVTTNVVGLQIPVQGYVNSIAYDPTGSRLLTSHETGEIGPGREGYIRVIDRANGQDSATYERIGKHIDTAKWDNSGQRILALSDARIVLWDVVSGQVIQIISELELGTDGEGNTYETGQIRAFDLNPVNNDLVVVESVIVSFWDAPYYTTQRLENIIGGSVAIEWSTDGQFVATAGGTNRVVNIIDSVTGEVLNTINTSSSVEAIAWNPVTSALAIGETTATGEPVILRDPVHDSELAIDSLTLLNADEDQPITEDAVIDLATLDTNNFSIRAKTTPATVGSVVFDLNGTVLTDNTAPYEFTNWTPTPGAYTLTATPYSDLGVAGTPLTISFTVVDDS